MTTTANPDTAPAPDQTDPQQHREHHHRSSGRPMRIRRVSMLHGWYWLIEGFALWLRNPAFLSFLTFGCFLAAFAAALVPYVGELLCMILYPSLTLGVYNGCRAIDRRRQLRPELLLSGFRRRVYDMLLAGFCNFAVIKLVLLGTIQIDDGVLWKLLENSEVSDTLTLSSPGFLYALLAVAILLIPWGIAFLFVSQLVGWWRLPVSRALSSSFVGCLRNLLPLLVYSFCFLFFACMLPALVINFINLTMEGLGTLACAIYVLLIVPVLLASFYVAARDIFGLPRRRKHRRRSEQQAQELQETEPNE